MCIFDDFLLIIDSKLNYRDHSTKTIARAKQNWNIIKSLCNRKWSLAVPTLLLLYKTTILPSLFYAAPFWLEKNLKYVTLVRNNFIRIVFRHGFSPNIDSCQVLLGTPPLDLLSHTAINVKFHLKLKLEDESKLWTHDASSSFPDSVANLLESHVTRFGKFLRIHKCTRYKQQDVKLFINYLWNLRLKNNDNKSFLKCYTRTSPFCNTISPLLNLQRYEAIKICEMLIGKSFVLADYAWNNWQTESPMSHCGKSEETTEHFFLACGLYQDIRPEDLDSLNLLDPEDCNTVLTYINNQ